MLGTVDIGAECFVGMHTAIGLNIVMEDRSCIDDNSLLSDGTICCEASNGLGPRQRSPMCCVPRAMPSVRANYGPFYLD